MLSHDDLANKIEMDFLLVMDTGLSQHEIDDMLPWRRELFIDLLDQRRKEHERNKSSR